MRESLSGVTAMQMGKRLGDGLGVLARVLNIISDRFAIAAEVDHHIVINDAVVHRRAGPKLYIKTVGRGVIFEVGAHSLKSLSLNTL